MLASVVTGQYCRVHQLLFIRSLEDVSEVLVCYSLGVYEMQSNPQANRVIA